MVYLTTKEIHQLLVTRDKIEGDYNKIVFDSFIFNCECGLRYADLSRLAKSHFTRIPEHKNLRTLQKYSNFANDELLKKNLDQILRKLKKQKQKKTVKP